MARRWKTQTYLSHPAHAQTHGFRTPPSGFVFWPVGTGDSTTVVVDKTDAVFQVDLHHLSKSEDDDEVHVPIVDELVRLLPKKDGRPYLAGFALTHPDKDHILASQTS